MNKFGVMLGCFVAFGAASAFGSVVSVCNGAGTNSGSIVLSTLTNADGYQCGDKIFKNFTSSGGTGSIVFSELATDQYSVTFSPTGGAITTAFSLGYEVDVDTVMAPSSFINQIQVQMLTSVATGSPAIPNASTGTVTLNPGTGFVLNAITSPGQTNSSNVATTHDIVTIAYNPTGTAGQPAGKLLSIGETITQANVPEPMTFSLMGVGLLGLGLLRKRLR